jgi:hypothetical protein
MGVKNSRVERRRNLREMHLDRRKSDADVIEHIIRGVRRQVQTTSDDRPARRHGPHARKRTQDRQ